MTVPAHDERDEHDDSAWLAHLAGHDAPADPRTAHEARLLRNWLQNTHTTPQAPSEAALEKLLFRLKREGLLRHKKSLGWHKFVPTALVATLVLAVGISLIPWRGVDIPADTPTVRGGKRTTLVITVNNPDIALQEWREVLDKNKIGYTLKNNHTIQLPPLSAWPPDLYVLAERYNLRPQGNIDISFQLRK